MAVPERTRRRLPGCPGSRRLRSMSSSVGHEFGAAPGELGVHRHVHRDLDELLGVLVGVVPAEDEFSAFSELDLELSRSVATVAPFIGGGGSHRLWRRREGGGHSRPPLVVTDELDLILVTHTLPNTCILAAVPLFAGSEVT